MIELAELQDRTATPTYTVSENDAWCPNALWDMITRYTRCIVTLTYTILKASGLNYSPIASVILATKPDKKQPESTHRNPNTIIYLCATWPACLL